jgi:hypothetical protein
MDGSPPRDRRDVEAVHAFGDAHPDVFGGLYVDATRLRVGLT